MLKGQPSTKQNKFEYIVNDCMCVCWIIGKNHQFEFVAVFSSVFSANKYVCLSAVFYNKSLWTRKVKKKRRHEAWNLIFCNVHTYDGD